MSETKIPKFASFRPKPTPAVPDEVEGKDVSKAKREGGRETDDREESRRGHDYRKLHSEDRRSRHTSKTQETSRRHGRSVETEQSSQPPKDERTEIFIVDRKGDFNNLVYGSIHRYNIPPFHRAGAGGVLGASPDIKIDRDYSDDKGIILASRGELKPKSREKYVFSKIEREKPRLLKIRREITAEESTADEVDYIPLQTSRGKKRKRDQTGEDSGTDDEETNYRSIHGKAKPKNEPEDNNFRYATESESSGSETGRDINLDASVRQRTVELSRKVEQFPHDTGAWLALIAHQDTLIRTRGDQRRPTAAEIRSTADIKIHMFEKALENARSLEDRETLLLGLMHEGAKIWEVKTQSDRWEQISRENIDSLVLWKSYLSFKQTTFGKFQYEEVRDIFTKRIKLLLQAAEADTIYDLYHQIVYVLLRVTIFVRESGYAELAVAIWQGLLEYNFFGPPQSVSPSDKISLLREFWESEVPRIGEDAALGWRHFVENEGESEAPGPLIDDEENLLDNRHIFKSWAAAEHTRSRASRVPARTMDEVIEDDPFRVILVSDIEDFLVAFPTKSDDLRNSLIDAFLIFCRLPLVTSHDEASRSWSNDPFIGGAPLQFEPAWIGRKYSTDIEMARDVDITSIFTTPISNFRSSPSSMFDSSWFNSLRVWRDVYSGDDGPVQYKWFRNALKQLLQVHYREDLAEYHLALEWQNEPENIKKVSKSLLKQHPSSLRLYNAYAMIEWSKGNKEVARSVYSAALNMGKTLPDNDCDVSILLWESLIWAYLKELDNGSALNHILSIESGSPNDDISVTPFVLLKTKQHLSLRRDYQLYSGDIYIAIIYAECLALLEYLSTKPANETQSSSQGNITAALSVYTGFSQTLSQTLKDRNLSDASAHELFLQSAARLLYHHARIGPFRPALMREHLTKSLTLFPQNTIFLSLYTFNESRLRTDNRVRNILLSTVLTPSNDVLTSRLFAIHYEITHGTIHSVRSTFEHALSAPSCKSSPGLWRLYILYCLQVPKFRPQAKDVWDRAIRACPWAKTLFILGFEMLDSSVEFAELKGRWRVMGEKGLRVHVDLEDKFDELSVLEGG